MRSFFQLSSLMGCFLIFSVRATAEEAPRTTIDRAMKAVGGETSLARVKAVKTQIKGQIHHEDGAIAFTAVTLQQLPDKFKHIMQYQRNGQPFTQIQVFNGAALMISVNTQLLNLDAELSRALLKGRYADQLTALVPLKEPGYELTSLGESKVEGKEVVGIKVVAKDRPDVRLYFDKQSALLVKTEHQQLDPRTRQEVTQEVYYSDYRAPDSSARDETLLKQAKIGVDGPALLTYFRSLTNTAASREAIAALIKELGDDTFEVREKASTKLIALGSAAIPQLKEALKESDLEIVRRAERCLQLIGQDPVKTKQESTLPAAAARLLALRQPEGSVEVLLQYLTGTPDEEVAVEIRAALAALAFHDGKPDKVLEQALNDKDPVRRAAAAEALGKTPPTVAGRKQIINGLLRPMKVSVYRAGRKFMEWEVTDVAYFNKLEDKLFVFP